MKKISYSFASVLLVVVSILTITTASATELTEDSIKQIYLWQIEPYGEYPVVECENKLLLDIQIWTLARFTSECADRLFASDFERLNTFVFEPEEVDGFALGNADVQSIQTMFSDSKDAQMTAIRIGLMNAALGKKIAEKNLTLAIDGVNAIDKEWYISMLLTVQKVQISLDLGLYLPENKDKFNEIWSKT